MKIIVGLGNPGSAYERTRHNVGFDTLAQLAKKFSAEPPRAKFESQIAEVNLAGERTLLVWPQTFMNRSGGAIRQVVQFYKVELPDLLVVCDDFNLRLGQLRLRPSGSAGGQNGLADTLRQLGTEEIARLRIGIGPPPAGKDAASFVLAKFLPAEQTEIEVTIADAAAAVECWTTRGLAAAMNQFNTNSKTEP
jgi:peptidyl-tRNA hydrolase, PTH1 family